MLLPLRTISATKGSCQERRGVLTHILGSDERRLTHLCGVDAVSIDLVDHLHSGVDRLRLRRLRRSELLLSQIPDLSKLFSKLRIRD